MKKLLALLLAISYCAIANADTLNAANIQIKISGPITDNRYFLCLPNIGCLSLLAAKRGKIYPILHNVEMDNIFVTNISDMSIYPQGLPKSCDVSVKTNQTITIYGKLVSSNNRLKVNNLRCSVA